MTKVEKAISSIRDMVIQKEYDENGYLPSEGELSETLGVSRATIREAVRALEVRGFIKRIHGKGIKAVDRGMMNLTQSISDMIDMQDLSIASVLEARWIIETQASRLAAERISDEELEELGKIVEDMESKTVADDSYYECDYQFHQALVSASGNGILKAIVMAYSKWLMEVIEKSSNIDQNLEASHHFHRNIYEALKLRDKDKTSQAVRVHLTCTAENLQYTLHGDSLV